MFIFLFGIVFDPVVQEPYYQYYVLDFSAEFPLCFTMNRQAYKQWTDNEDNHVVCKVSSVVLAERL